MIIKSVKVMIPSGIEQRTNHQDSDSRWTPRSQPWTTGENEGEA